MDIERLQKIFESYTDKYDSFNTDEHKEIYKWIVASRFQKYWDLDAEDFGSMFKMAMDGADLLLSESAFQPINGIVHMCRQDSSVQEFIRDEFKTLLDDEVSDLTERQARAENFVRNINDMLRKTEPEKWKYHQEISSAMMFLGFAYPEDNYLYKEEEVRVFASYIGYESAIQKDDQVDMAAYYQMCEDVLAELQQHQEILDMTAEALAMEARRRDDQAITEIDGENHLLVFDIIYCALNYEFYEGLQSGRKKSRKSAASETDAEQQARSLKEEAEQLAAEIEKAMQERNALTYPELLHTEVIHAKFGTGVIVEQQDKYLKAEFPGVGVKKFVLPNAFTGGFLKSTSGDYAAYCSKMTELDDRIRKMQLQLNLLKMNLD
ncbi:MAG: hypothetical protein Q4B22_07340 [Eubacteriales bacterium]|nr:hypothetical protein [Eubacteriales bacterium]